MCPRSIAGVPSSQALPGNLNIAPPSLCVPDVPGVLAVWIQNKTKQTTTLLTCTLATLTPLLRMQTDITPRVFPYKSLEIRLMPFFTALNPL